MSATSDAQVVGPQEKGEGLKVVKWLEQLRRRRQAERDHAVLNEKVLPVFSEAFRVLAQSIEQLIIRRHLKSILVMSAYPGEGRTTVVVNLGISMARLGKQVILVDADTHHPSHFALLASLRPGPAAKNDTESIFKGEQAGWHRPKVAETGVVGLKVFSPGSREAEIFGPRGIRHLLQALTSECDLVLIDSSSCLQHSEAFEIAPLADGVVYVVQRRTQDRGAQRRVRSHLESLGGKLLGVVYNEG